MSGEASPPRQQITVDPISSQAVPITVVSRGRPEATATGFVVGLPIPGAALLITNRHVVRGRHQDTDVLLGSAPDVLEPVYLVPTADGSLQWMARREPLYDSNGDPRWIEDPQHGAAVDVVALPISLEGIAPSPIDPSRRVMAGPNRAETDIALSPAGTVLIVGFPLGLTGGAALGVWVRGSIASEPALDWQGLPRFLVDSRTRQGQSGSPVFAQADDGRLSDGSWTLGGGPIRQFVGVYSGRVSGESDLGIVWKANVVEQLIAAADL